MKKVFVFICICFVALGISVSVFAENEDVGMPCHMGKPGVKQGMMKDKMAGRNKMMGMNPMMTNKTLVATSDGGIVILNGNKLQKYDKDLVLKKEVEIKTDMAAMQEMMSQMMDGMQGMMKGFMEKCPMMNAGKDKGAMPALEAETKLPTEAPKE